MRTIVNTIEVFKIEELTGVNRRNALEATSRQAHELWVEIESHDLIESMSKAAEHFGLRVIDYSVGLFSRSYVKIDTGYFDEEQAEYAVEWINENHKDGREGSCPFTGVDYDCYFFDYFGDADMELGLTEENVQEHIVRAIVHMLEKAVYNAEADVTNDDYLLDCIAGEEYEFTSDGEIYRG